MSKYIKDTSDTPVLPSKSRYIKNVSDGNDVSDMISGRSRSPFFMRVATLALLTVSYVFALVSETNIGKSLNAGVIAPVLYAVICILYLVIKKEVSPFKDSDFTKVIVAYITIIGAFALSALANMSFDHGIKIIISVLPIICFTFIGYDAKALKFTSYILGAASLVVICDYTFGGLTKNWNPNSVGIIVTMGIMWIFFARAVNGKKFIIFDYAIIGTAIVLMLVTNCRSVLLGLFVCLIVVLFMPKSTMINIKSYRAYYIISLLIPIVFIIVITALYAMPGSAELDRLSLQYTGKLFFSGREELWVTILTDAEGIIFGSGRIIYSNAHNFYISLYSTSGLLGVASYVFLLVTVFEYLGKFMYDKIVRTCVNVFLSVFLIMSFESFMVNMNANDIIPQMFLAAAIGRASMLYLEEKRKSVPTKEETADNVFSGRRYEL